MCVLTVCVTTTNFIIHSALKSLKILKNSSQKNSHFLKKPTSNLIGDHDPKTNFKWDFFCKFRALCYTSLMNISQSTCDRFWPGKNMFYCIMLSKYTFQVLFEFRIKALDCLFRADIHKSLDECDFFSKSDSEILLRHNNHDVYSCRGFGLLTLLSIKSSIMWWGL